MWKFWRSVSSCCLCCSNYVKNKGGKRQGEVRNCTFNTFFCKSKIYPTDTRLSEVQHALEQALFPPEQRNSPGSVLKNLSITQPTHPSIITVQNIQPEHNSRINHVFFPQSSTCWNEEGQETKDIF